MKTVLGLDIGGANLKAATSDKRARSVPFALWKQPDQLPTALAELVAEFGEIDEIALTMTGELCDCFTTKRDGVNCILDAALRVSRSRPVWVWGTDGKWRHTEDARKDYLVVASANWHALAKFASEYLPDGTGLLIDVGSTTTDIIPIRNHVPISQGKTDTDRLAFNELVYTGVRRTPACMFLGFRGAGELFATTLDAHLLLGHIPEDESDTDTADGRPATKKHAHGRMSRMVCGDPELVSEEITRSLSEGIFSQQVDTLGEAADLVRRHLNRKCNRSDDGRVPVIVAGSGEHLASEAAGRVTSGISWTGTEYASSERVISLTAKIGRDLSACAPAYAVAVLLAERQQSIVSRALRSIGL